MMGKRLHKLFGLLLHLGIKLVDHARLDELLIEILQLLNKLAFLLDLYCWHIIGGSTGYAVL